MNIRSSSTKLAPAQSIARVAMICGVSLAMLVLRAVNPETAGWLFPRASCGAVTGLPCIFCGTTRAMHHLLNGDFARALYFNWMALPLTAAALMAVLLFAAEVMLQRRLMAGSFSFHVTPRRVVIIACTITALWLFQATLAVGLNKRELLNSAGLLYPLFVR